MTANLIWPTEKELAIKNYKKSLEPNRGLKTSLDAEKA